MDTSPGPVKAGVSPGFLAHDQIQTEVTRSHVRAKNQAEFQDFIICGLLSPEHSILRSSMKNIQQSHAALNSGLSRDSPP